MDSSLHVYMVYFFVLKTNTKLNASQIPMSKKVQNHQRNRQSVKIQNTSMKYQRNDIFEFATKQAYKKWILVAVEDIMKRL